MILVQVKIRSNDNTTVELSAGQRLLSFLAIDNRIEFDEYLSKKGKSIDATKPHTEQYNAVVQ